jgi:glycosyltransferase involved in cell wall biosynthesis
MVDMPRITFGMIVLNGEPFVRYNLRSLYPFAHQIVVVEGGTQSAKGIAATSGHSTDGTLETLRRFREEEDPQGKLVIVTAEEEGHSDGFWLGHKDEMSKAYAKRATGDWLWQVDVDEFYTDDALRAVCRMILDDPSIATISFPQVTFWGSPDYWVDGPFMRDPSTAGGECHRLFKWGPGFVYETHRPVTVLDSQGHDLRTRKWIRGHVMRDRHVFMFHYSLLFPRQVVEKCRYYQSIGWPGTEEYVQWATNEWGGQVRPFHVHNVREAVSWLERYKGRHPAQIDRMWQDVNQGRVLAQCREMVDVEGLFRSAIFRTVRTLIRRWPTEGDLYKRGQYRFEKSLLWLATWFDRHWQRRRE